MLCADGSSGHGEDGVDADRAHERAFAGHVGAADKEDFRLVADAEVVADTFFGRDEGVAQLLSVEAGWTFEEFREGVGGVLVAVVNRRSSAPRRRFFQATGGLSALSLLAPAAFADTTASKIALVGVHLVAAAIIVPVLARHAH